ncbi:MAG TPA: metallophosphoesterase family protein [Anaerolineaceae bacterium]|nr:metallophosphoesterase family protein [Anaerolineaceae bacterium]
MRTLIISDIHANLTALEAVIAHAGSFERTICLGDLVGYGPDPNECVRLIRGLPNMTCIMGNHDAALMGFIDISVFNGDAFAALNIQNEMLEQDVRDFLELLPVRTELDHITLAHGSPRNPIWEYILNSSTASVNFPDFDTRSCLTGHTHIPSIFIEREVDLPRILLPQSGDRWKPEAKFILNPGSVGQPRDRDHRASYVVYDSKEDTWEFKRAAYDIEAVIRRFEERKLPARLGQRLKRGI